MKQINRSPLSYVSRIVRIVFLTFMAAISLFPFLWMLLSSLKTNDILFNFPIEWFPKDPQWDNYRRVWDGTSFLRAYGNTFFVATVATAGMVTTSLFAAYSFSKLRYKGRDVLFLMYLSVLMIPWHAIMVPQFIIMKKLNLMNSLWGLVLLHSFNPFGVFLLRQFFLGIPGELSEAARIDGCSDLRILWGMIVPLSKAAIASLVIFSFLGEWNDYLGPLIYLSNEKLNTIQLALKNFQSLFSMDYVLTFAGTVCSLVPIVALYVFCQKYFTEGIAFSGLKG